MIINLHTGQASQRYISNITHALLWTRCLCLQERARSDFEIFLMQYLLLTSRERQISDFKRCAFCFTSSDSISQSHWWGAGMFSQLRGVTNVTVSRSVALQFHFSHISPPLMISLWVLINVKCSITSSDPLSPCDKRRNLIRGHFWVSAHHYPVPTWDDKHTAAWGLFNGLLFMPVLSTEKLLNRTRKMKLESLSPFLSFYLSLWV